MPNPSFEQQLQVRLMITRQELQSIINAIEDRGWEYAQQLRTIIRDIDDAACLIDTIATDLDDASYTSDSPQEDDNDV